jgi:PAS domain S-box-containing protein
MVSGVSAAPLAELALQVDDLRRRAERARLGDPSAGVQVLVQDLETAAEELRVAEEEVRTQGEQIERLLKSRDVLRRRYERLTAALPVAVVTTDRHGRITAVNPAAAALFGVRLEHLTRKPLFVFLDERDRHRLRDVLSSVQRGAASGSCGVTLRARGQERAVVAYAGPDSGSGREVTWVMLEPELASAADAGTGTSDLPARLPAALHSLSAVGAGALDLRAGLQVAAETCATALGTGTEVGICWGPPADPRVMASTSTAIQELDGRQLRAGAGPAWTAYDEGELISSSDISADPRWSSDPSPLEGLGPRCCVSVPLRDGEVVGGVMTVLMVTDQPLSTTYVHVVESLAAAVASLVQESQLRTEMQTLGEDMQAALASRAVIDQAKGIVMADHRCSADQAFQHLVTLSNSTHRKVRDVAQAIVDQVATS